MSIPRIFPTILAVVVAIAIASCGDDPPAGPVGPLPITFELAIPPAIILPGNYYATSGTISQNGLARIGDTTIEVRTRTYYAQFCPTPGTPLPGKVTLNGTALSSHRGTDTLRLATAGTASKIEGTNNWGLSDSATGTPQIFPMAPVEPLDSIAPLEISSTVRADTSLRLRWKAPSTGSMGIYMTWTANSTKYSYSDFIGDGGSFTIPAEQLKKLTGTGKVTFTRFIRDAKTFNGRAVSLVRVAQRVYKVTVQP